MNSISNKAITKTHIYIGPAALSPPLQDTDELIIVTGDKGKWPRKLIERRSCPETGKSVLVKINTIGKPGATKKWYRFNHPFLNGTLSEELISWCNEGLAVEELETDEIECTKIDDIINEANKDSRILLSVAQGDPLLTIKRAKKILHRVDTIDISLHPLALIWLKDINEYLSEVGFTSIPNHQLTWQRQAINSQVVPLANPPESQIFLTDHLQLLLDSVQLDEIREDYPEWSNLYLMRQIAIGSVRADKKISIIKTARKRLVDLYQSKFKKGKNYAQKTTYPQNLAPINQLPKAESISVIVNSEPQRQILRGHIDGFDQSMHLRGWVDASDFGAGPSTVKAIWKEKGEIIGESIADLNRPDLIAAGIQNGECGFSINLRNLHNFSLIEVLDQKISLDLIESKSGQAINNDSWILDTKIKGKIIASKFNRAGNYLQKNKTAEDSSTRNPLLETESKPEVIDSEPQLQVLRGHIDGFDQSMDLRGWVDASDFGAGPTTVKVIWREKGEIIGEGIADLDRPDLIAAGILNGQCGFSINVKKLNSFSLLEVLDQKISLDLIESKSGQIISNDSWILDAKIKREIIGLILENYLRNSKSAEIQHYLDNARDSDNLITARSYMISYSALQCQIGNWNCLPIAHAISNQTSNPLLNFGADSESAYRLELILAGLSCLIRWFDKDNIHGNYLNKESASNSDFNQIDTLSKKLKETCYSGIQGWEMSIWARRIRPLFDTLMATIFLQNTSLEMGRAIPLLNSLSLVAESVYTDPGLSFQLRSLVNLSSYPVFREEDIDLDLKRQDRFSILLKTYSNRLQNKKINKNINYCGAAIDFASSSPSIFDRLTNLFELYLSQHLKENNRQSISKHWVDRFGQIANGMTQNLVGDLIDYNFPRHEIVDVHAKMIDIKKRLAELLFNRNTEPDNTTYYERKNQNKKWLIIGDKDLAQCWIYRVEQKKQHLEELGCEVRCIDWQDLRFWSFTNDILWCDSLVVCRLPAFYSVFRAMAFARHNSKKIYAEIDDLIFTEEYPAEYESYGGTISHQKHDNLSIDYILRKEVMNYADEVIVSTKVLAEKCKEILSEPQKPVHILPNLPLKDLNNLIGNYDQIVEKKSKKCGKNIILTSGTLSHKQILNETIFPILNEVLAEDPDTTLSTIGHITLPTSFDQYKDRIISIPFTDYPSYLNALSQGDLALVPLEQHATTDGKSAIKWMEASYCGVACICSPVRAYTDVTKDQNDVYIAESPHQWKQSILKLLSNSKLRQELAHKAFESAQNQFNDDVGTTFWHELIKQNEAETPSKVKTKKVLIINVYFAPQSIGGATRVAQDYVREMLDDPNTNYEVTILCTEFDHWQSDNGQKRPPKQRSEEAIPFKIIQATQQHADKLSNHNPDLQTLREINKEIDEEVINFHEQISLDVSFWHGARVVRLNVTGKPWSIHEDKAIEEFCTEFFAKEQFDEIQCHCCQIITASPLIVANNMKIPYDIIMHDAWWMSPEQFLVSKSGSVIDPSDPLGHFDKEPNEEEIIEALERREFLFGILKNARQRIAVSKTFAEICEQAGIEDVSFKENKFTSMSNALTSTKSFNEPYNVCHIGGMSLHKGFQLLRNAVNQLPQNIPLNFTIVDHRLTTPADEYSSIWNGYKVKFIAPIAMNQMSNFYASQDVLVAPSIWPESFGLVTREAISAGLWVIASDSGALAEPLKVEPSKGTITRPNHIEDLIDALKNLPNQLQHS